MPDKSSTSAEDHLTATSEPRKGPPGSGPLQHDRSPLSATAGASAPRLVDRYAVADVDSHVIEPPDLWTSRMSARKWGDLIPRVGPDPKYAEDRWWLGDRRLFGVGAYAAAGWVEYPPSHPRAFDEIVPAAYEAQARLAHLDDAGIRYQLLYGNILGFQSHAFLQAGQDFATACVRAFNDFLTDFCAADPSRLIPLAMLPFWDVTASVREIERTAAMGHRGVVLASDFEKIGFPPLYDEHWDPILSAAQSLRLPINFHVGFAASVDDIKKLSNLSDTLSFVKESSMQLLGNARTVAEVVVSGLCARYPDLAWVSVENGAGWLNFLAESLDWQWLNSGAVGRYPDRLLPSEYMQRQVYFTYWFERASMRSALDRFADNLMFETDFPHPTSLSPGPASAAAPPSEVIDESLGDLAGDVVGKILNGNAARIYRLDAVPALK